MAKRKKAGKKKARLDFGSLALVGVFLFSAIFAYYPVGTAGIALIALLGAMMSIKHVQRHEENEFLISVTAFTVVSAAVLTLTSGELSAFLINLVIGLGVGGFLVSLGKIVKLGWK